MFNKINKKGILLLLSLILLLSLNLNLYADEELKGFVIDDEGILTDEEYQTVSDELDRIYDTYGGQHIILLNKTTDINEFYKYYTDGNQGFGNPEVSTNNFYEYWDLGYGEERTGSIMLIDLSGGEGNRHIVIRNFGLLVDEYDDGVAEDVIGDMVDLIVEDDDIYGAVNAHIEMLEECHKRIGVLDENGNLVTPSYFEKVLIVLKKFYVHIIALIISLIIILIINSKYKGESDVEAKTYENVGNFKLELQRDIFLYSNTTSRKLASDDDSSSSSSGGSATF